ncbi:hypothetical protein cce_2185 [Crocosphaera subtropica ATCC 51142]|uniref:Uncharacterized protein n=1 Tax=Crocosphaera subtropica (strain ATCC 51142 / BH68) TaxID=43989 RepID=B1WPG5_CROS5|nr:DUF1822 family protein [Crocosphaera subtropica]ACB51535.1 hypothetical protein cce_2185 [Crocosphaera subtropica ATCC 51142]
MLSVLPLRQLEIVGQEYLLSIIPQANIAPNTWQFELRNKRKSGLIPGGFKLRLLTEAGESFPNNEAIATEAVESLYLTLSIKPKTILMLEIEPIPENYHREILIF